MDLGTILFLDNFDNNTNLIQRNICIDLKHGKVYKALFRLTCYKAWKKIAKNYSKPDKNLLKLEVMIYYRLRHYKKVFDIADQGNQLLQYHEEFSQTLIGFKALAQTHLGQIKEARALLEYAKNEWPSNIYYLHSLSYICAQQGKISDALQYALSAMKNFEPTHIVPSLNMAAQLLCELALSEYPLNRAGFSQRVSEAKDYALKAISEKA